MIVLELALIYIRNGTEMILPIRDIDQAVCLADAIADSDLLNDDVDYNMFDLCEYHNRKIGYSWESENGEDFDEYWETVRKAHYGTEDM